MEDVVFAGVTVVILIAWLFLQRMVMTPYDIYRKWASDVAYTSPEAVELRLDKTKRAIKTLEAVFDTHGPNSDAGREAAECLQKLRRAESALRLQK